VRRPAVLALLLLACAATAVALLLLKGGPNGHGAARRHETRTGPGGTPSDPTGAMPEAGAALSALAALDDDPNRVPGAELLLRGRVVRDGSGVEDAIVVAVRAYRDLTAARTATATFDMPPPAIATAKSGADGAFELRIARRTRVVLRATKPGAGYGSLFLLMPAEGDPPEVTIRLRPGGRVEGIVVDEKAAPVPDAEVAIGTTDWARPVAEASVRTDAEGRFVLEDAPEGGLRVRVNAKGYPEARSRVQVPSQRFVRIELRPKGIVAGRVVDAGGAGMAGARVLLTTSAWERGTAGGAATAQTDESGAYKIEIYPGAVQTAVVEHPRIGRQAAGAETFDLPTGLVETGKELKYDIRLKRGVAVFGRVVYAETQAPAAGTTVTLLRMSLQWRGLSDADAVRADAEGRFVFPYVTEGTYGFEAKGDGGARLATRYPQGGGQRATVDVFVDGETPPPEQRLELVATGGVRGRFLGLGEPDMTQRQSVFLQLQGNNYLNATMDDLGAFEITHVPPMEGAVVQSNNPVAKSDPFRIEAGKVAEVTLDLAKQGGVTGVVEDEAGRPVARARVQVSPQAVFQQEVSQFQQQRGWGGALTDEQGRFTVSSISRWGDHYAAQKHVAFASREGYAMAIGEPFDLPRPGVAAPDLRLVLRSGGVVRGRVEFSTGAPAAGVHVTLSPKQDPAAQQRALETGQPQDTRASQYAYTDFDGRFEVKGIGDGAYLAFAYHPQSKSEGREVRAGDDGVKIVLEPALAIAGVVVTDTGHPVSQAAVAVLVMTPAGEQRQNMSQTGANGRFRIGQVAPGSYTLQVSANQQYWGYVQTFETKRVEGVAAGAEDLVIVVMEGKGLRGRVEDPRGEPVAGAGVIAMTLKSEQPAQGTPAAQTYFGGAGESRPSAVTNGRGEFELKGVGSAEVELLAIADGYSPATQRAVAGGAPVVLRLQGGETIEGRLLKSDGTPAARQWLWLQPASEEAQQKLNDWQQRGGQAYGYLGGWNMNSGTTDAEGRFRFAALVPGEYLVQMQGTEETLPATKLRTGVASVTLTLERALAIRGRVVDASGQPISVPPGQMIYVSSRVGERWLSSAPAGSDGRFEIKGLPSGTVTLQAWAPGYNAAQVDAVAGTDTVVIALEKSAPQPVPPPKQR
jgi:protocatechuate 3,4-dioxygenase beta subunit